MRKRRTRRDKARGAMIEMSRSVTIGVEIQRERSKRRIKGALLQRPVPCMEAPTAIDTSTTPRQKCRTFALAQDLQGARKPAFNHVGTGRALDGTARQARRKEPEPRRTPKKSDRSP